MEDSRSLKWYNDILCYARKLVGNESSAGPLSALCRYAYYMLTDLLLTALLLKVNVDARALLPRAVPKHTVTAKLMEAELVER